MAAKTVNGHVKASKMNGQPASISGSTTSGNHTSRRGRRKPQRTYAGWAFDKMLKVAVWYAIITLIFRCPSALHDLTEDSPAICKPSLKSKEVVWPYVEPYYDQYLGHHVKRAQPYLDEWNERVYKPGLDAYETYGAPRVTQARAIGLQQWERSVKPQLAVGRKLAAEQYGVLLAPHVRKVQDAVSPYYERVSTSAKDIWELELGPVYHKTSPYVQQGYAYGQHLAVTTILPATGRAGNVVWSFWTRQIWPRVRILYGENVEPQLNRITERLGRYRDGKRLEAEIQSMESESKAAEASSEIPSIASSVSSAYSTIAESITETSSTATSLSTSEPKPTVSPIEQFRIDLKNWENICAKAVDEGSEDLKERISDIAAHQKKSQAQGVADALLIQLEETAASAMDSVRTRINVLAGGLPDDASEDQIEAATATLRQAIRAAGQSVKSRAQAIRDWHQSYESEIDSLVAMALLSTLETIDGIRELRLSEIGRRYADADLPHKEWSNYNDVKKATKSWRMKVEQLARGHSAVTDAKAAGEDLESQGMGIAEETAKELARLKQVGQWKLAAQDTTENFETRIIPPKAEKIRRKVVDAAMDAKDAIVGQSEQGSVEYATSIASDAASSAASSAASAAESLSDQVSRAVLGKETPVVEKAASDIKDAAQSGASKVSEAVVGKDTPVAERAAMSAKSSAQIVISQGSEAVVGSQTPAVQEMVNEATSSVANAASRLSENIVGRDTPVAESIARQASESVKSVASQASSAVDGHQTSVKSATSQIKQTGISAATTVSEAIIGTDSKITDTMAAAVTKVSEAMEPAPSFDAEHLASVYPSVRREVRSLVEKAASIKERARSRQVAESRSALGGSPYAENIMAKAKARRDAASSSIASAESQGSSSASSAVVEASSSGSSIASVATNDAASMASVVSESVSSVASAASATASTASSKVFAGAYAQIITEAREPILDDDIVDGDATYSERIQSMINDAKDQADQLTQAIADAMKRATSTPGHVESLTSLASEQYESAMTAASSILFGRETPAIEKGTSAAQELYLSAVTAASYAIYGSPTLVGDVAASATSFASSVSSAASVQYSAALRQASEQFELARSQIAAQISGNPKPMHEKLYASALSMFSDSAAAASNQLQAALAALPTTRSVQNVYEGISSIASVQLTEGLKIASEQYSYAKSAVGAQPSSIVPQQYLASAQAAYYQGVGMAHEQYSSFLDAASSAVGATPTTGFQAFVNAARETQNAAISAASSNFQSLLSAATAIVAGSTPTPAQSYLSQISSRYDAAVSVASSQFMDASKQASEAIFGTTPGFVESAGSVANEALYGTPGPIYESMASVASENWNALISQASEKVYGAPPPMTDVFMNQASSYAAQATEAALAQYEAVQLLFSELVIGKEPEFTDSVMSRLHSAYSTNAPAVVSSASSYASAAYSSASSYVEAVFTTPPSMDTFLAQITDQLNAVADAASSQVYGTQKGTFEQATEAAAKAYSDASSQVSEAIIGRETGYVEAAQSSMSEIAMLASKSLSEAIYGTPTGTVEAVQNSAASIYSSLTSVAAEQASAASSAISSALYTQENDYIENMQAQIAAAVASVQSRLEEYAAQATEAVADTCSQGSSAAVDAARSVSSAVSSATSMIKDEL